MSKKPEHLYIITIEKMMVKDGHIYAGSFMGILSEDEVAKSPDENIRAAYEEIEKNQTWREGVRPCTREELDAYVENTVAGVSDTAEFMNLFNSELADALAHDDSEGKKN